MGKKKFSGMAIILSIVALVAIAAAVFVVFKFVINDPKGPANEPVDAASVTQNANLTNWGFACEIDGEMYYSDHETGIYVSRESGDELFIEGRYSDLCDLGGKLVCTEYYMKQYDETSSTECMQLAMIDLESREKKIVFDTPNDEDTLILLHRANDVVYFSLSEDMLYTVDQSGEVTYTGVSHVKKVTNSGIYTNKYSEKGLRLSSFENKEIRTYDSLDTYKVEVNFETEEYIYLKLTQDDGTTWDFVRMDVDTDEFTSLPYQNEYGTMRSMNYLDGQLYMTFYDEGKCYVCKASETGSQLTLITTLDSTSEWLNLISIAADKMYISFPYSDTGSKLVALQ